MGGLGAGLLLELGVISSKLRLAVGCLGSNQTMDKLNVFRVEK